jgi:TctA family transporter
MELFSAFTDALVRIFHPTILLVTFVSTVVALVFGILPAISGALVCILILPFLYGMDPFIGMPILCALFSVSCMGGSITAILLGIPGDNINAATVIDGFAMTRKGQGGRALGLSLAANILGALASIGISFLLIPMIVPIIMTFKTAEMLLIIVVALLFISVLTKHNRIKGLIAAGIGLLLSCIGYQASTGVARFTFGNLYLYEGLETPTVLMGILAMPVLLELHATGSTIAPSDMTGAGRLSELVGGMKELLRSYKSIWFRGSVIGYFFGLLPGIGGAACVWMVYGHAKQTSRHPEEFGKGAPDGIVAPEAASNSAHPGDLLITLALGIPGSGVMVVLLAAFLMMGVTPGPKLLIEHTTLCFEMLLTVAAANIMGAALFFFGAPLLTKVTRVSPRYIFGYLIPLIVISTFVTREYMVDMIAFAIISLIGLFMTRFGFSAPALLLGFVLGKMFERYLTLALDLHGFKFFIASPATIVLTVLCLVTIFFEQIQMFLGKILHRKVDILTDDDD